MNEIDYINGISINELIDMKPHIVLSPDDHPHVLFGFHYTEIHLKNIIIVIDPAYVNKMVRREAVDGIDFTVFEEYIRLMNL